MTVLRTPRAILIAGACAIFSAVAAPTGLAGLQDTLVVPTPRLWASVTVADALQEIPGGRLLPVGLSTYGNPALIERLASEGERSFPIDAANVFGLREHHSEYRITLPEGWEADLPDDRVQSIVIRTPDGGE